MLSGWGFYFFLLLGCSFLEIVYICVCVHVCVYVCVCVCMRCYFSHVQFFVTLWAVPHQAPLSMGILQARILEWVAMSSFRGSFQSRDRSCISYISCVGSLVLYHQHHLGSPYYQYTYTKTMAKFSQDEVFLFM